MKAISDQPSAVSQRRGRNGRPVRMALLNADSRWPTATSAFTLIEILTVIVIITVLAGIVVGAAKHSQMEGARKRAKTEIAMMEMALESYKNDNGVYPMSTDIRVNNTANSILLYYALAGGTKQYFSFKPNQLKNNGSTINITIACVPTILTVPNVVVMDPFGVPYNYFNKPACSTYGQTNIATFDLWSYGPNNFNDEGTNDDISNWQQN